MYNSQSTSYNVSNYIEYVLCTLSIIFDGLEKGHMNDRGDDTRDLNEE